MQIASSDPHVDPHSETRIHWIANLIKRKNAAKPDSQVDWCWLAGGSVYYWQEQICYGELPSCGDLPLCGDLPR